MPIPPWLPDGKNQAEYPDPKTASTDQWAWEFLRRNEEFQNDAKQANELFHQPPVITNSSASFPGQREAKLLMGKWGIRCWHIPNPSKPNEWDNHEVELEFYGHVMQSGHATNIFKRPSMPIQFRRDTEVVINFDLEFSIHEQLETAKSLLLESQAAFGFKPKLSSRARGPNKLLDYLRVHDGKSSGLSETEIGRMLYRHLNTSRENLKSKVDADFEAANMLIKGGYRYLRLKDE